jgi:anti-anti-sigma factor
MIHTMSDDRSPRQPTIDVRSPEPHAVLVVLGGEHDVASAEELRQTFDQSLGRCDHLIVDLSAVEFIDSTTIRVLMETRGHAIERDRKFSIVLGTAAIVERVLDISGILKLVNVVPTVERALAGSVDATTALAR